jgi:hypothetical protein
MDDFATSKFQVAQIGELLFLRGRASSNNCE